MDERNHEVLALAFKRAKAKTLKIKELAITPKMTKKAIDTLIVKLSDVKMAEPDNTKNRNDTVKGQRWYIEDLVAFSAMDPQARLDNEYNNCFSDIASEDEMLLALEALLA